MKIIISHKIHIHYSRVRGIESQITVIDISHFLVILPQYSQTCVINHCDRHITIFNDSTVRETV